MTSLLRLRFYFLPNMSSCRVSAEWATRRPCSSSTGGRWFRRRSWRAGPCVAWWTTSPSKPSATPCGPWSYPPPGPPRAIFKPPPCSPSEWRARPKKPSRTAPSWKPRATAARGTEETARRRRRRRRRGIRSLSGLSVESFPCLALRVSLCLSVGLFYYLYIRGYAELSWKKNPKRGVFLLFLQWTHLGVRRWSGHAVTESLRPTGQRLMGTLAPSSVTSPWWLSLPFISIFV